MSLPSFNQVIVLTGLPSYLQVNIAGRPKSTVCVAGSTAVFKGAVTVNTVSTDSPKKYRKLLVEVLKRRRVISRYEATKGINAALIADEQQ